MAIEGRLRPTNGERGVTTGPGVPAHSSPVTDRWGYDALGHTPDGTR